MLKTVRYVTKEFNMGLLDDMKAKIDQATNTPTAKEKIEQIARDKDISIEDAKKYYLQHTT